MLYLPDTNVFSIYFRRRDETLVAKVGAAFPHLRLSTVVLAELEYGAAKTGLARHRARVDGLAASITIEPLLPEDAARYGRLRSELERRGEIIGPFDALVAAHALRLGATVVTRNLREFARVPGLKCENWQSE
jgi:tRNA(fMet)-specific endonuclease VapC